MAFAALTTGVSGIQAFTEGVSVVADNIANVNTTAFKRTESEFASIVTASGGSTKFAPGGVELVANRLVSEQGLLTPTSSETDLAIDGAGFFIVTDLSEPPTGMTPSIEFSRSGNFTPDADGFLVNAAGQFLQGFPIDINGNIPTNLGDINQLQAINTNGLTGSAEATTSVQVNGNLLNTAPIVAAGPNDIATGAVTAQTVQSTFIFDSQGSQTELNIGFVRTGVNAARVEVFAPNPADVNNPNGVVLSGTLTFNPDGTVNDFTPDVPAGPAVGGAAGAPVEVTGTVDFTNGAANSDIVFNFGTFGQADGLTQFDSPSTISTVTNGAVFGNVIGLTVDEGGIVNAVFDNGLTRDIFQLPLATFPNPDGLTAQTGNSFTQSDLSGNPNFVLPGQSGAGQVISGSLESSTVDLAQEFSDLIVNQRAFSANARTISTSDEILQELTNII